ncbi:hypothetical protein K438DRAFT_1776844 [Mycena galopus ATCC 62051]|nr:hypothetical protein K438DRAFT_1776844 [Mycena galopus ATCC 62051]
MRAAFWKGRHLGVPRALTATPERVRPAERAQSRGASPACGNRRDSTQKEEEKSRQCAVLKVRDFGAPRARRTSAHGQQNVRGPGAHHPRPGAVRENVQRKVAGSIFEGSAWVHRALTATLERTQPPEGLQTRGALLAARNRAPEDGKKTRKNCEFWI